MVTGVYAPQFATQAKPSVMNMAPWFGSPRPGQTWAQASADQMYAAYGTAELQRRRLPELTLGSTLRAPARPLAAIEQVWDDHNVEEHKQIGMLLHAEFVVSGMLKRKGSVTAYFYQNAGFVRDSNGRLLCVSAPFVPPYEITHYKNFPLFMPYEDFPFGWGTHSLAWRIVIWAHQDDPGQRPLRLLQSEFIEFDFQVS